MIGQSPSFTVSDFVAVFNQSLDMLYPEVVITGELANFRISKNAWVYFDLKDELASVKVFGSVRVLPGPLEEGMMLEVVARPYLHPQFGFSLQVSSVAVVGEGSLGKAYLLLLKKLESEGLFNAERKRELPFAPEEIVLVTSKESAAYGDFMKIISRRWPKTKVVLFNVQVQGRDAPGQIVDALQKAGQHGSAEVVVIIRGGGSKDDLAAFDHEAVVRAVAASRVPTLVAIGHERDVALSEMASDVRASTPSNAAEILVPDQIEEKRSLEASALYLSSLITKFKDTLVQEVEDYKQALTDNLNHIYSEAVKYIGYSDKLLEAYDPKQPLSRGYILAKDKHGKLIRSKIKAVDSRQFNLEFYDGTLGVKVDKE